MVYLLNLCFYILAEALRKALTILNYWLMLYLKDIYWSMLVWSFPGLRFSWEESQERQMQLEKIFGQMSED